ncbi:hypothetical protein DAI22_10g029500 [Oryza sativa Japonica Group]|nr:hypothetical protein DAI22_10g029500 [Oryza sativa Japonica Group]
MSDEWLREAELSYEPAQGPAAPPHPKTLGGPPPHLPLAVIWYLGAPTSPSGRPPPCLPCCRSGKKKGRRRKGKKEAEEIEVKMEMWGLITRCPWRLR